MKRLMSLVLITCSFFACTNQKSADTAPAASDSAVAPPPKPQPAEFADPKYADIGKKGLDALSSNDIDGWMTGFADNAV